MLPDFIRLHRTYFIPVAIARHYGSAGHHGVYLFPEFQLGSDYRVDYLIVAGNSDGFHFQFVEFGKPHGRITMQDGDFGQEIRKGLSQIDYWALWLVANYLTL